MTDCAEPLKKPTPIVSIIIPVYNDEKHVARAIDSALNQTLKEIEVIVVDDGSTDGTPEILKRYEGRIKIIRQENKGVSAARNAGIKASKGKYIAFLDSDDIVMPRKCEVQAKVLDEHPEVGLCCGVWEDINELTGSVITRQPQLPGDWADISTFKTPFAASSALVRGEWVKTIIGFDEVLGFAEDWDFWWRLGVAGCKFVQTDDLVTRILVRQTSNCRNPEKRLAGSLRLAEKYYWDTPGETPDGPTPRDKKYAEAWMIAGSGRLRLGNFEGAVQAWAKALSYDASIFLLPGTWSSAAHLSTPNYLSSKGVVSKDLSRVEKRLFELFQAASAEVSSSGERYPYRKQLAVLRMALASFALSKGRSWRARWWAVRSLLLGRGRLPTVMSWRRLSQIFLGPTLTRSVVFVLGVLRRLKGRISRREVS